MFSAKVVHKNHLTHSELEEQPAAAVATHCSGREVLPMEYLGVLGRCRAVGCTCLAETHHSVCLTPLRSPAWLGPTRQLGLEAFEVSAERGAAGRRWGKGRDWVGQRTGRSWRGQQRWEWSVGQQSKGV